MNETMRSIEKRFSCRNYDGVLPGKEQLDAIAKAAVQAPSGMNRQPWQVVVITNKGLIEEMDDAGMAVLASQEDKTTYNRFMERGGKLFYNAPCMFLILQQPKTDLDTGIVSENIALAAEALGLNSVICGMARIPLDAPQGPAFLEKIKIPEGYEFGMAVLVGNGTAKGTPHLPDLSKIRFVE